MITTLRVGALSLCLLALCTRCGAEQITFELDGAVTDVPDALLGVFAIGDPISGSYTFDADAIDSLPDDPSQGSYPFSVGSFQMTIGGYAITHNGDGDIAIEDNFAGRDSYTVVSFANGDSINGANPFLMALQLSDSTQTIFSTDLMPVLPPDPTQFDQPDITIDFSGGGLSRLVGSLQVLQAPEPSSGTLVLWGSLVLLLRQKRRRRVAQI